MIPHAKLVFSWEAAGGRFYNVFDVRNSVYEHGSTISERTVKMLGLPVVETAEHEEDLVHMMNALYMKLKGSAKIN